LCIIKQVFSGGLAAPQFYFKKLGVILDSQILYTIVLWSQHVRIKQMWKRILQVAGAIETILGAVMLYKPSIIPIEFNDKIAIFLIILGVLTLIMAFWPERKDVVKRNKINDAEDSTISEGHNNTISGGKGNRIGKKY